MTGHAGQQGGSVSAPNSGRRRPMKPGRIAFVGSGPGDPGLLTARARAVLANAALVFTDPDVSPAVLKTVGADLPPMGIILMMMALFLIMGAFMDWVGIVLLAMPVFLPIVKQLGYDPVWFGILFCVNMQVSFLSPPFGPAAFYLKSVAPPYISLTDIFKSFLPFICIQLFVLALMLMFPMLTHVFL